MQVLAFLILFGAPVGMFLGASWAIDNTYEDVNVSFHRINTHRLGYYDQGEVVAARVEIDEGRVKVLEGRFATIHLLDSENKASLDLGEGYLPLETVKIDGITTDVGTFSYEAHRGDTYYIAYVNEDSWDLTLRVADGDALTEQLYIKVFTTGLFVAFILLFAREYGLIFDVNVKEALGLARRPKGPGSMAAREKEPPTLEEDIIE
jgi:hypothetical protein